MIVKVKNLSLAVKDKRALEDSGDGSMAKY